MCKYVSIILVNLLFSTSKYVQDTPHGVRVPRVQQEQGVLIVLRHRASAQIPQALQCQ